jgi:hypothetical protein
VPVMLVVFRCYLFVVGEVVFIMDVIIVVVPIVIV